MGADTTFFVLILVGIDAFGGTLFVYAYLSGSQLMLTFMATMLIVFNFIIVLILKSGVIPKEAAGAGGSSFMKSFKAMNMSGITGRRKFGRYRGI